jgi:signal peptidase I
MQTLGLSDSTPKSEGRLRALLWPRINNEVAAATAAQNAMYATFAVAALTVLAVLLRVVNPSSLPEVAVLLILCVILGIGIRQFSVTASTLMLAFYVINIVATVVARAYGPGTVATFVVPVIATCLFAGGLRAAWFMRKENMVLAPLWRWTRAVVLVSFGFLFALMGVQTFVLRAFFMPSGSMEPTLLIGDHFFVLRPAFMGEVRRGDLIAFRAPYDNKSSSVKRVVGVPGDHIHFENGRFFLNGAPIDEPYVSHENRYPDAFRDEFPNGPPPAITAYAAGARMLEEDVHNGELLVPRGNYFVVGDNRSNSLDSRYWGFVPYANVLGRPVWIYDSKVSDGRRPGRSGTWIHRFIIDQGTARLARNSAFTPSTQSTAACFDSGIRPPTAVSTVDASSVASSARVLPSIHSVSAEPAAMDAVQPRIL